MNKKRYYYYVSYYWFSEQDNGVGTINVYSAGKILTVEHIEQVKDYIIKSENKSDVVILSWNEIEKD